MATSSTFSEIDLPTSSAEEVTRTFDPQPGSEPGAAPPGPATGDVLGDRFVVHERLSAGAASRVYRALDRQREAAGEDEPWVVLKVVTTAPDHESRALRALRREAAIGQGIEHPNLPWLRGIDTDGPHTFLCMAWLEGESLAAILDGRRTRPMTRVQAMHIIDGVGRALGHLHQLGVTHADVKPGNILVDSKGHATLLDLGVALAPGTSAEADSPPTAHGYTPQYASPEVLAGELPTPADDLFSLACVAYRMLSGHRAFDDGTSREAAANGARPAQPDNLAPAQWRAIDQALAWRRAERQADVQTFLQQLKGARDEAVATAELAAPAAPTGLDSGDPFIEQNRRNAQRLWPAAAVMAGALVAAAVYFNNSPDAVPPPVAQLAVVEPKPEPEPLQPAAISRPPTVDKTPPAAVLPTPKPTPPTTLPPPTARPAPARPPAQRATTSPAPRVSPEDRSRNQGSGATDSTTIKSTTSEAPKPATTLNAALKDTSTGALADTRPAPPAATARVPFSKLKVRRYVEPRFPRNAEARRLVGWVDVTFSVDSSGQTTNVRVIGAEPPGVFDDAALLAVRRWRFDADESATEPVNSGIRIRFDPK